MNTANSRCVSRPRLRCASLVAPLLVVAWAGGCAEPPAIKLGSRRELFVDRLLVERLDGATLKLHEPVSGGTVIRIDKPWEGPANFGMSVIELDGRLLMYYRGWPVNDPKDENGVGCVAESRDGGATWSKTAPANTGPSKLPTAAPLYKVPTTPATDLAPK